MQSLCARPYREEFKLDHEIVLEKLYEAGNLIEDRHDHIKPRYYPKPMTKEEIEKQTKLPAERVSKILDFFCSRSEFSEPKETVVKKVVIEKIEKYQITEFGIRMLKVLGSPPIIPRDEYGDEKFPRYINS
jgi:hypothetical protein